MKDNYKDIMEDIIDYQAELQKSFWNYDYEGIERYARKIQVLINKILKDNSLLVEKPL